MVYTRGEKGCDSCEASSNLVKISGSRSSSVQADHE